MIKYALLAGAMVVSVPALAQTTTPAAPGAVPGSTTTPAAPQNAPVTSTAPAPATAQPETGPATAAQPAASGDQVAAVVEKEFPTYDKNADGKLSKVEFSAWMLALKSASDPSVKAEDPATKTWMTQAFTQADTDKSKTVSKDELTNFLTQATKAS